LLWGFLGAMIIKLKCCFVKYLTNLDKLCCYPMESD
jgi:hypothetical protein